MDFKKQVTAALLAWLVIAGFISAMVGLIFLYENSSPTVRGVLQIGLIVFGLALGTAVGLMDPNVQKSLERSTQ